jgi:hypothetical protein
MRASMIVLCLVLSSCSSLPPTKPPPTLTRIEIESALRRYVGSNVEIGVDFLRQQGFGQVQVVQHDNAVKGLQALWCERQTTIETFVTNRTQVTLLTDEKQKIVDFQVTEGLVGP